MVSACSIITRNGTGNVAKVDKPCYPYVKDNKDAKFAYRLYSACYPVAFFMGSG